MRFLAALMTAILAGLAFLFLFLKSAFRNVSNEVARTRERPRPEPLAANTGSPKEIWFIRHQKISLLLASLTLGVSFITGWLAHRSYSLQKLLTIQRFIPDLIEGGEGRKLALSAMALTDEIDLAVYFAKQNPDRPAVAAMASIAVSDLSSSESRAGAREFLKWRFLARRNTMVQIREKGKSVWRWGVVTDPDGVIVAVDKYLFSIQCEEIDVLISRNLPSDAKIHCERAGSDAPYLKIQEEESGLASIPVLPISDIDQGETVFGVTFSVNPDDEPITVSVGTIQMVTDAGFLDIKFHEPATHDFILDGQARLIAVRDGRDYSRGQDNYVPARY